MKMASQLSQINTLLTNYSKDNVEFPKSDSKDASKYVMDRVNPIMKYIRDNSTAFRGDLIHIGSSYSCVKICQPDEFDLHVPLKFTKGEKKQMSYTKDGQRYYGFSDDKYNEKTIKTIPNDVNVIGTPGKALKGPKPAHGFVHCPKYSMKHDAIGVKGDVVPYMARKELKSHCYSKKSTSGTPQR